MSEERAKILKLLKEGRISVEEAGLLLDALDEGSEATSSGAERSGGERRSSGAERSEESAHACHEGWGSSDWGEKWRKEWRGPWSNFDFSKFPGGFESAFRGMEQSLRDAFKNFSGINLDVRLGHLFGRERAEAERLLVLPAGGITALCLKNAWGDVEVLSTDAQEIRITAKILAWGYDSASASASASGIEITQQREGGRLVIQHHPTQGAGPVRYKADFEITVPREIEIELKGMSGNLKLEGTRGKARLVTLSGDIRLKGVKGEIVAESKSGDVEAERCSGDLNISTMSGEIAALDHHGRAVAGRTVSGDIQANLILEDGATVDLRTVRGDIRLKLPVSANLEIAAESATGDIDCVLPLAYEEQSSKRILGVLNRREGRVGLSTKSGSISIRPLN